MKKKKGATKGSLLPSVLADVASCSISNARSRSSRTMKHHASGTLNVDYWRERLAAVSRNFALDGVGSGPRKPGKGRKIDQ